jgi:hypothetical protein
MLAFIRGRENRKVRLLAQHDFAGLDLVTRGGEGPSRPSVASVGTIPSNIIQEECGELNKQGRASRIAGVEKSEPIARLHDCMIEDLRLQDRMTKKAPDTDFRGLIVFKNDKS